MYNSNSTFQSTVPVLGFCVEIYRGGRVMASRKKANTLKEKCVGEIMGYAGGYASLTQFYAGISKTIDIRCSKNIVAKTNIGRSNDIIACNDIAVYYNAIINCSLSKFNSSVKDHKKRNVYQKQYRRYVNCALKKLNKTLGGMSPQDLEDGVELHLINICVV